MEPARTTDQAAPRNRSAGSAQQPNEFKVARQLTRHSAAEVAKVLGVSRSTVSRWESGELEAPGHIIDWLQRNRNQSFVNRFPLCGLDEPRGMAARVARAEALYPQTAAMAKAAEKA